MLNPHVCQDLASSELEALRQADVSLCKASLTATTATAQLTSLDTAFQVQSAESVPIQREVQ